jgi:hypothetical protein
LSDNAPALYLCDFLFALYACLQLREGIADAEAARLLPWRILLKALSEQNSKYLERPSNRSDRPENTGKSMATKSGSDILAK